jgi:transcriptional regulator GlxA family with amidase domain
VKFALSHDDVGEIKSLCQTHMQRDVAKLFRVHESTISRARRGLSWRSDGPVEPHRANAKLTEAAVREIRLSPLSLTALARRFGVCPRSIRRAIRYETWSDVA